MQLFPSHDPGGPPVRAPIATGINRDVIELRPIIHL
jgi:hypothetical protein